MTETLKNLARCIFPQLEFDSFESHSINQRRLEHLASSHFDLERKDVLELGSGTGNLTGFFVDRGCNVLCVEGRKRNIRILRKRFPDKIRILHQDIEELDGSAILGNFDIVFCYGILYHMRNPAKLIEFISVNCKKLLLLETCCSTSGEINPVNEPRLSPSQSLHGLGCRPSVAWLSTTLKTHFRSVCVPGVQPFHPEFEEGKTALFRRVFIAEK